MATKKKRNTTGYINVHSTNVHSIGNMYIPMKKGTFIKDPAKLIFQYDNLIRKLGKRYSQNFSTYEEDQDLYSYIVEAFIELVREYDPYSGVDFPGYIVKKLPLRIRFSYISKKFLQRSRVVLLHSGQYSINSLLDLIQDHGDGQVTTDKSNRVSKIQRPSKIDFTFKERLEDIIDKVPMDRLDGIIFKYLVDGFSRYSYITYLVEKYDNKHSLKYTEDEIRQHIRSLKKKLRNYYLQVSDSPVLLKKRA